MGNKQEYGTLALQRYLSINRKQLLTAIFGHDVLRPLHISRVHLIHPEHVYIREAGRNMGKGKKNTRVTKRREKGMLILTCHGYQHNGNTDSLRKQNLLFFYFQFIWDIFEHFYTAWNVEAKYYPLSNISNLNETY